MRPLRCAGALLLLAGPVLAQARPGSGLQQGTELVYASGGARQPAWVFDSVLHEPDPGVYSTCIRFQRRGQDPRRLCARSDTLFERGAENRMRPSRPIGPTQRFESRLANGGRVIYETARASVRQIGGLTITVIPTVITTLDSAGDAVRRLREDYSPALLTAARGVFEEPDSAGLWRIMREFELVDVRNLRRAGPPRANDRAHRSWR